MKLRKSSSSSTIGRVLLGGGEIVRHVNRKFVSQALVLFVAASAWICSGENAKSQTGIDTIQYPGAPFSFTPAINDSGEVAGTFSPNGPPCVYNGFIYNNGSYATFGPQLTQGECGIGVLTHGLNNSGEIVGEWLGPDKGKGSPQKGFIEANGKFSTFKFPESSRTAACGINDSGDIVGGYTNSGYANCLLPSSEQGFLLSKGSYSTVNYPSATATTLNGINNKEQIVGTYTLSNGLWYGFLYQNGVFTPLSVNYGGNSIPFLPYGINDEGIAAGTDEYRDIQFLVNVNSGSQSVVTVPQNGDLIADNNEGEFVGFLSDFSSGFTGDSPPDELTMATIGEITYSAAQGNSSPPVTDPSGTFTNVDSLEQKNRADQFYANVYANSSQGNDWVVVAIRGTELYEKNGDIDWYAAINNLLADSSFAKKKPTVSTELADQVGDAAKLLVAVSQAYPSSQIYLTGHSLGGAIAMILGYASGLPSVGFDAPGVKAILDDKRLLNKLRALSGIKFNNVGDTIDVRMEGDVVSQAGEFFDESIFSISAPASIEAYEGKWSAALDFHYIQTMVAQLQTEAPRQGFYGPDSPTLIAAVDATYSVVKSEINSPLLFTFNAKLAKDIGICPKDDLEVEFEEVAGSNSPPISTVNLPDIPGIVGYGVSQLQSDGTWTEPIPVNPLQTYTIPGGSTGIAFYAVNQKGKPTRMPTFDFDVSFGASGLVQVQLADVNLVTAARVSRYFSTKLNSPGR